MYATRKLTEPRTKAISLVFLMILLPWASTFSNFQNTNFLAEGKKQGRLLTRSMGEGGYNDTGWIVLEATGSNLENGTPAIGDLFLEFAPGAVIDNLTLEVAVNGSDGDG